MYMCAHKHTKNVILLIKDNATGLNPCCLLILMFSSSQGYYSFRLNGDVLYKSNFSWCDLGIVLNTYD